MAVVKAVSPAGRHSRCRIHLYAAASRLVVGNLGTFESSFQVRTHRIDIRTDCVAEVVSEVYPDNAGFFDHEIELFGSGDRLAKGPGRRFPKCAEPGAGWMASFIPQSSIKSLNVVRRWRYISRYSAMPL